MYIKTNQLPEIVQRQLKNRGFSKNDICVEAASTYSLNSGFSGEGLWAYTDVVDLASDLIDSNTGSWGGSNMFNPTNPVDLGTDKFDLSVTKMVIKGSEEYKPYATVYIHPSIINNFSSGVQEVTAEEKEVLQVFRSYKPAYRKEYLSEKSFNVNETIKNLISKKLIKQNAAGSLSLTTEGKNASY